MMKCEKIFKDNLEQITEAKYLRFSGTILSKLIEK